ncbi:MAG: metalloregulator ArsR/SmtB family transcription factor [Patescibacteria group bacterium]
MKEYERVLKALANRRRLIIVARLKKRNEATVGDIAEYLNLSFKSTSKHLGVLSKSDILEKRQQGLEVFYFLNPKLPKLAISVISHL